MLSSYKTGTAHGAMSKAIFLSNIRVTAFTLSLLAVAFISSSTKAHAADPARGINDSQSAVGTSGGDPVSPRRKRFRDAFNAGAASRDASAADTAVSTQPALNTGGLAGTDVQSMGPPEGAPGGFAQDGAAGGAMRGRRMGGPRMGGPRMGAGLGGGFGRSPLDLSQLNLTEEQKNKIKSMRADGQVKGKQYQQNLKAKRQELRDLFFDPLATEKQIRAKHAELRQAQEQAEGLMVNDFIAIRSVLTDEQRKQLPMLKPGMGGAGLGKRDPAARAARMERRQAGNGNLR